LYGLVARYLDGFVRDCAEKGRPVPDFVERELREYLRCGVLSHGFVRVRCGACGKGRLVPFSCKGRGVCSSCGGRRMAETAAHLVDSVIPRVPVRQWVLSVPPAVRYVLAYDSGSRSAVLAVLVRAVSSYYRRKARAEHGVAGETGAVTAIQGGALDLNPHDHSGWADGVWTAGEEPRFWPVTPPTQEEVEALTRTIAGRVVRLLVRRGRLDADGHVVERPHELDEPMLSAAAAASIRQADESGWGVERLRAEPKPAHDTGRACARADGFSLHAGVVSRPRTTASAWSTCFVTCCGRRSSTTGCGCARTGRSWSS
jgi:hypothetical protein